MARILVVDDDKSNARVASVILTKLGRHRVAVSEAGDEIVAKCRSGEIDLVVMDVSLSHTTYQGMRTDGVQLTKLLKSLPETAALPIVLFTAHAMGSDRDRLMRACGADGYIKKPIENRVFLREIEGLLTRPSPIPGTR